MRSAALIGALLLLAACAVSSEECIVDCAAGVRVGRHFYYTVDHVEERSVLGRQIATVIGEYCVCDAEPRAAGRGEALGSSIGDKVYSVAGYRTSVRVATLHHGDIALNERHDQTWAHHGRDIFALSGKVVRITSRRAHGESLVLTNPQHIARIVRGIEASIVDRRVRTSEPRMVTFHLRNGTKTVVGLDPDTRALDHRLLLPRHVVRALTPP